MSEQLNSENTFFDLKPDINGISDTEVIKLSSDAINEIKKIITENEVGDEFFLRLGLRGGGFEGTEFFIEFDSEIGKNDRKYIIDEISFIIDTRSLFFLIGYSINYLDDAFILTETKNKQD